MMNVKTIIDNEMKVIGLQRKGRLWIADKGALLHLATLVKSRFGEIYHLECGVVVKGFEPQSLNDAIYWHIFSRPEMIHPDPSYFLNAFDLEQNLSPAERESRLKEAVQLSKVKVFDRFADVASVIEYLDDIQVSISCNERVLHEIRAAIR